MTQVTRKNHVQEHTFFYCFLHHPFLLFDFRQTAVSRANVRLHQVTQGHANVAVALGQKKLLKPEISWSRSAFQVLRRQESLSFQEDPRVPKVASLQEGRSSRGALEMPQPFSDLRRPQRAVRLVHTQPTRKKSRFQEAVLTRHLPTSAHWKASNLKRRWQNWGALISRGDESACLDACSGY